MKYKQLVTAIETADGHLVRRAVAVVNQALVVRNWIVGAYIVEFEQQGEDRAMYGERLLEKLAMDLEPKIQGLSLTNLKQSRQLFRLYPQIGQTLSDLFEKLTSLPLVPVPGKRKKQQKVAIELGLSRLSRAISQTASDQSCRVLPHLDAGVLLQLSWSHFVELIRFDDPLKRAFYENECLKANWSVRQLQRQIGSLLFERTELSKNKRAVIARAQRQEPPPQIVELIRDPYVLEFLNLAGRHEYSESELESALLDHLQQFLLELGVGFCFEARQKRITVGNEHDYLDLVFYHRLLRCHVLLDLKIRSFSHADAGQMNFYLNYYKTKIMAKGDNPPIGIILCSDKDQTKVEFATSGLDNKLFVSRYLVALPSAEQLSYFVERDRAAIETGAGGRSVSQSHPRQQRKGRSSRISGK